jgi:hypothetical protein
MKSPLNALCISDLQIPAEHKHALDFVLHVKKTFFRGVEPRVINMGDEVDQHTLSKYGANPNGLSAKAEFDEAKLRLKEWYKFFPTTRVCISNHTYRVMKRAFAAGIPEGFMKTIGEAYEAPSTWLWAQRWMIDGVLFEHGEAVSGPLAAIRAALQNRLPTVIGHQHSNGGVMWNASAFDTIWGMNTGCLIDIDHYAFEYGRVLRNKPTLGMGVICDGIPYFVPMLVDKEGNWLRRV